MVLVSAVGVQCLKDWNCPLSSPRPEGTARFRAVCFKVDPNKLEFLHLRTLKTIFEKLLKQLEILDSKQLSMVIVFKYKKNNSIYSLLIKK